MRIIKRDDLPLGGFAGIVETRMVMNPAIWPDSASNHNISHGLGDFIYMAIGHFNPNDGAPMHPHRDVDIVTLVSSGKIGHEGSNGGGEVIEAPGVQVQRAGTGMTHSEFSVLPKKAHFVQLWFSPPSAGLKPAYQNISIPKNGELVSVLGLESAGRFNSNILCEIGYLKEGEELNIAKSCIAIIFQGDAIANEGKVDLGDLIEASKLSLKAGRETGLILITENK